MDAADLDKLSQLSPFELKNRLIKLAASHADRVMLNAGRGNPNFLATAPRHGFFQLGLFAMAEVENCAGGMPEGVAGLPTVEGIGARFETFAQARRDMPGIAFLRAAVCYARDQLGVADGAFLYELVQGVLGCNYPEPVRMLPHVEEVIRRYLLKEMTGGSPLTKGINLFAVEGGTAGITYVFNSLP